MSAFDTLLADAGARLRTLLEIYPLDTAGDEVPLYLATSPFSSGAGDSLAHQLYEPRLDRFIGVSGQGLTVGELVDVPKLETPEVRALGLLGDLDLWRAYRWAGARAVVRLGGYSPTLGRELTLVECRSWQRVVESVVVDDAGATIRFKALGARLDGSLQQRRYRGTSWCYDCAGAASISLGLPAKLDVRGDITFEAWIFPGSIGTAQRIVGHEGATTYPYRVNLTAAGALRFVDSASTVDVTSTATLAAGRWYHVAMSLSGTAYRLQLWSEATATETVETATVSASTRPTQTGTLALSPSSARFSGMLDEVRLWSVGRTERQVRRARHRELTAVEAGLAELVGYWRFNDGAGTTVADASSSPANGTISGLGSWLPALQGREEAGLAGEPRPDAWGVCLNAPGRQVWDTIWELHCGSLQGIDAVRAGYATGTTLNAAYTDVRLFLRGTTPAGQHDTCISASGSYVRFGTAPSNPPTFDLRGDNGNGYASTAAGIAYEILTRRGRVPVAAGELEAGDWSTLAAAAPATCGFYAAERWATVDAVRFLLGSVLGELWTDRATGKLRAAQWATPSGLPVAEIDETTILATDGRARLALEPIEPAGWIVVRCRRNWRPLTRTELVSTVRGTADEAFASREWRSRWAESDYAQDQGDGVTKLERETALTLAADGAAYAEQLLALFGVEQELLTVEVARGGLDLEVGDVIGVTFRDLDSGGRPQVRLGLEAALFRVLAVDAGAGDGSAVVHAWRPKP